MLEISDDIITPYHLLNIDQLNKNLYILSYLKSETKCKILFAIKGYSNEAIFPYIRENLDGISTSSLFETNLAHKKFGKEIHTFSSAYKFNEINEIVEYSDYIIFNSLNQLKTFHHYINKDKCNIGIRINPEYSEIKHFNINPCHEYSRFGILAKNLEQIYNFEIKYLHMHTMCDQFSDTLERTLNVISKNFNEYLNYAKWINIGGGQLFTNKNYNIEHAIKCIKNFKEKYKIDIYMEPCESVMLNTGYLITSVVDIINNGMNTAILDSSAVCHLPNILYSGQRYNIINGFLPNQQKYTYRLTGPTCYAGDIFGDYSFYEPLKIDDKIIFCDTAQYTMVKSNMFNGISFPTIVFYTQKYGFKIIKQYDYNIFKLIT